MRPSLLYPDIIATNPSKTMFVNALVQGEVIGKEDYGYTVSLGFNDTKAFYKCDTFEKQCRNAVYVTCSGDRNATSLPYLETG